MDLRTYLTTLKTDKARDDFATKCETSIGHLRNCAYGSRTPSAELAVLIEKHTKRAVRRQDLLPDRFRAIWPELKAA